MRIGRIFHSFSSLSKYITTYAVSVGQVVFISFFSFTMITAVGTFYLLCAFFVCQVQSTSNRTCWNDTVDFATKIERSSTVVYGKTIGKILDDNMDGTFRVMFQVDCIFKGPATARQINITRAGKSEPDTTGPA